jgi:hypothetical protein
MSFANAEIIAPPAPSAKPARQRGDPNLAPRCGAKARTTGRACRAPAMKNGRCRLHGGKSTGPRTAEGMARMAAAHTTHGKHTDAGAPERTMRRHVRTIVTRVRLACAVTKARAYLTPEMAAELEQGPATLWVPKHPSQVAFEAGLTSTPCNLAEAGSAGPAKVNWRVVERAAARAEAASQAPWKAAIAFARAAKRAARVAKRAARMAKRAARAEAAAAKWGGADIDPMQPSRRGGGTGVGLVGERRPEAEPRLGEIDPMYPWVAARAAGLRAASPSPGSLRDPTPETSPGACLVRSWRPKPAARERWDAGGKGRESAARDINPMEPMRAGVGNAPGLGSAAARQPEAESTLVEINPLFRELAFRAAGLRVVPPSPGSLRDPTSPAMRERCTSRPGEIHPIRLTPTKATALESTTLGRAWTLTELRGDLAKRFGPAPPPIEWHAPQALRSGGGAGFWG